MEADVARRVAEHPGWYHTIDLADGVTTPGYCDLRPFAPEALPPSLAGKRCLDVGTFDGFWAFELERRGGNVVALDLTDISEADTPPNTRAQVMAEREAGGAPAWGAGFHLAHEALGSSVRRVTGNVYDLDAELIGGPVDLVLCGTLLQHLRDPVAALERMRDVLAPGGELLMIEAYSRPLSRAHKRRPVGEFRPAVAGSLYTWWMPNLPTLEAWARAAALEPASELVLHEPVQGSGAGDHVSARRYRPAAQPAGG